MALSDSHRAEPKLERTCLCGWSGKSLSCEPDASSVRADDVPPAGSLAVDAETKARPVGSEPVVGVLG